MAELEAAQRPSKEGDRWREAKEFASLLEISEVVDMKPQLSNTRASGSKTRSQGALLDKNTHGTRSGSLRGKCQSSGTISSVRSSASGRKNLSPSSLPVGTGTWVHRHQAVSFRALRRLAEATPEAIREWIDQMQDSGLGLTINSKCSAVSGLVSKCMKSGLRVAFMASR